MNKICIVVCEHIRVQSMYDIVLNDAALLFCDGFTKCRDDKIDCTICLHVDEKRTRSKGDNKLVRYFNNDRFECFICDSGAVYQKKK